MNEAFYALMKCKIIKSHTAFLTPSSLCRDNVNKKTKKIKIVQGIVSSALLLKMKQPDLLVPFLPDSLTREGALVGSRHSSTLLEGSCRCSHVVHSARERGKKKPTKTIC